VDAVVKLAARFTVSDMMVEHPSLDEVFMSYYEQRPPEGGRPDEGQPWRR